MRQVIIKTASQLFTQKGVEKTSLAEIASEANISKGTLYYHFPTKNDLVFAVSVMHMDEINERLFNLLKSKDSIGNILIQIYSIIPTAVTRSRLHIYLLREAVTDSPQLYDKFQAIYKSWKKILVENIEKFNPEFEERDALASFVVASLDGLVIQNLLSIDETSPEKYAGLIEPYLKK